MNKEEIERRLIEGIRDNYTLNLAISILEDLDLANKKLDKIKEIINSFLDNWECGGALTEYHITGEPPSKDLQDILSIIGGE